MSRMNSPIKSLLVLIILRFSVFESFDWLCWCTNDCHYDSIQNIHTGKHNKNLFCQLFESQLPIFLSLLKNARITLFINHITFFRNEHTRTENANTNLIFTVNKFEPGFDFMEFKQNKCSHWKFSSFEYKVFTFFSRKVVENIEIALK